MTTHPNTRGWRRHRHEDGRRAIEGEELSIRFKTNRPAYIVVYYLDNAGKGAVLW